MIPIGLAIGFVLGVIPKSKWWMTLFVGVAWTAILLSDIVAITAGAMVGAFVLGVLNGLAGWGVGRFVLLMLRRLRKG